MTKEEKKSIVYIKKDLEKAEYLDLQIVNTDRTSIEKTLNLIEKQKKEIEVLKQENEYLNCICESDKDNYVPKEAIRRLLESEYNGIPMYELNRDYLAKNLKSLLGE